MSHSDMGNTPEWAKANTDARPRNVDVVVQNYVQRGWKIVSDGPTGVQLSGPKKMRKLDVVCLWIGMFTVCIYGMGLILVLFALIDYMIYPEQETVFLRRG